MPIIAGRSTARQFLPYAGLLTSTVLVVIARDGSGLRHRPLAESLVLAGVTAGWILLMVTLHPEWAGRRGPMTIFAVGLLALTGALVWSSPLFAFYSWTVYLLAMYALSGWALHAAAVAIGVCTALGQIALFDVASDGRMAVATLLFNVVIGVVMTRRNGLLWDRHARRARLVERLRDANRRLAAALEENEELHARLLEQAREAGVRDERQRLAGEIHDVLAQGLTGIVTQLEAAEQAGERADERSRHLATARRLAREGLAEARRSVRALRPGQLDAGRLPDVLADLARDFSARYGVRAEAVTTGPARPLLPEIEATLLRTAQEALTNVARHAEASRVALTLSYLEDVVTLDVRDDGSGFDPVVPSARTSEGGYGLTAMRERLHRVDGTCAVESEPGAGTAVSACVPAIAA